MEANGGLENIAAFTSKFADNFLTDAERLAPYNDYLSLQLQELGFSADMTAEQYRDAVTAQGEFADISNESRIALIGHIEEMARVRYALGRAAQQDAIRAQVEQTSLQRERIERIAAKEEAVAMLNAVLGRRADAALATPDGIPGLGVRSASQPTRSAERMHTRQCAQQARAEAAARTWCCSVATAFRTSPWAWVRCSSATASKAPS
jgi:hypothetical protein